MINVSQISIGRFHHFHLARYLNKYDLLYQIFTGYPKFKLKDEEDIPEFKIKSYPYLHTPYMAISRYFNFPKKIMNDLAYYARTTLDDYASRNIADSNVLIALSGSGVKTGISIKKKGGYWFCDRGSSHIIYQNNILKEEYENFSIKYTPIDQRIIDRELKEYESCDFISVPSNFAYNSFKKFGLEKKLFLNPYGSRTSRFYQSKKRNYDDFKILFVGQVTLQKGIFYLIEAFKKLKHPKKKMKIIGMVSQDIRDLFLKELTSEIEWTQRVENTMLRDFYSESNVFVMPSIQEGLAMVIGEAMGCGCPVIATTNTGAHNILDDQKEGFIISIRSSGEILEKLEILANSKYIQKQMSNNCILKVKRINGWNDYGNRWYKKIKSLDKKFL